ncbi:MAG: universal stress protein [Gemmatimonadales bacterium]|nr:MAG: universal stress protein [Gemmatimonadales bacterium]
MYRRILVPLDGSRFGEHALPPALAFARKLGAELNLATVALPASPEVDSPDRGMPRGEDARDRGLARATSYLDGVTDRIRETGFEGAVKAEVISAGNTSHSLVRHLIEVDADLVVMTTHGRGPIQRAWLGSTADGVIRRSPVPVLLLRPEEEEGDEGSANLTLDLEAGHIPYRRVLVPLDGSRSAEEVLAITPPLTEDDATFTLLKVVAPFIPGGSPYLPHVVRETRDEAVVESASRDYLDDAASRFDLGGRSVEIRTRLQGQAGMSILEVARDEAIELIAISTTGRGGVARMLLGSVADKVIRGSPCPVLVYRKPEES